MGNRNIEKVVLPSGRVRYYVRVTLDGRRQRLGGYKTAHEARAALRTEERLAAGAGTLTLGDFYKVWIAAKAKSVKPSTLTDYELVFRLHVLPVLGHRKLGKITPTEVQAWLSGLSEKDLSRATVNKCYRHFRNCLNSAVEKDLLGRTPCRGVIVPRPKQRVEFDILSPDEVASVLDAADEPEKTLFAVLAYSGLRLAEGLGLKWQDVDFEGHCIHVESTYGRYGWGTPKTASSRRAVPMSPTLEAMLEARYEEYGYDDEVVHSHDGETPLDPSNARRDFSKALKAAEIRHASLQSLRHFFASNMIASGCSIKYLQNALGHSSATMTLNTYAHLIPESGAVAMEGFEDRISGAAKPPQGQKKK